MADKEFEELVKQRIQIRCCEKDCIGTHFIGFHRSVTDNFIKECLSDVRNMKSKEKKEYIACKFGTLVWKTKFPSFALFVEQAKFKIASSDITKNPTTLSFAGKLVCEVSTVV